MKTPTREEIKMIVGLMMIRKELTEKVNKIQKDRKNQNHLVK